jgi:hypothetical protein
MNFPDSVACRDLSKGLAYQTKVHIAYYWLRMELHWHSGITQADEMRIVISGMSVMCDRAQSWCEAAVRLCSQQGLRAAAWQPPAARLQLPKPALPMQACTLAHTSPSQNSILLAHVCRPWSHTKHFICDLSAQGQSPASSEFGILHAEAPHIFSADCLRHPLCMHRGCRGRG